MALPPFLLAEMRLAFKTCVFRSSRIPLRSFSTTHIVFKRPNLPRSKSIHPQSDKNASPTKQRETQGSAGLTDGDSGNSSASEKRLVPKEQDAKPLDTGRRIPVPMKVLPKSNLAPNLQLSPKERLHVEVLTRRQPPLPEKKVYRERLLIYHWGFGREHALAILKVSCIVGLSAVLFIIGPAHVVAGTPLWMTSLIFAAGFVPLFVVNYLTKPMVSRVFLRLPPTARESPKAAMEYARNLPGNAELDIRFLRPWALEGSIQARLFEFEPAQNSWLRPLTFQWMARYVKKGSIVLPNPTKFFVAPKTAKGKAARDTIPGLWASVYKRLAGVETDAVSRWRR